MNAALLTWVLLLWTACIAVQNLTIAIHEQAQQQHNVLPVIPADVLAQAAEVIR